MMSREQEEPRQTGRQSFRQSCGEP